MFKKKIRLNKYISYAGICSRRNSDKLIQSGSIEVNGKIISKLGTIIDYYDEVKFNGEKIFLQEKIYLIINKPKGFITTTKDQFGRKTIMDLIPYYFFKRKIYPIGRLDYSTTGVLLLTNDGNFSEYLSHPKYRIQKIYNVTLNKEIKIEDIRKIKNGDIYLKEGKVIINFIMKLKKNQVKIGIHIGWNRIIKRIFGKLNYIVIKLDRISFGGITKKNIKIGNWKILKKNEIAKIYDTIKNNNIYEKNKYNKRT
ncbi:pseudouridine synthase [Blattabacterium cuenoti]|uniref:pseudouridine synthase n=1 Tax=Blattabacterium cuenoti TaxID=1653831 RepID=UPI00163BDB8C|nr:pseudouridine synthase [Blattabacterium cuenoti]